MRLTVVGCAGSYPGPDSPASSYLVEVDDGPRTWRVLLDLGSGALGKLQELADPLAVDAVFLSHLHPDHWFDMSGYYVMRKYHPAGRPQQIPVYGPRGTAERMASAYGLPVRPGMSEEFDVHVYDASRPVAVGPLKVEVAQVLHPVDAYALRLSHDGRTLVYSGDTAYCDTLVDLAQGCDVLLAEASFREGDPNPPNLHMTGREAGATAARAGVGRLLLTHIPPWFDPQTAYDEARGVFDGSVELARSGAVHDV